MMFGTTNGIDIVRNATLKNSEVKLFDEAEAVMELNESYRCFSDDSRYFNDDVSKEQVRKMVFKYGEKLMVKIVEKDYPKKSEKERKVIVEHSALGFGDCQLLLSLYHNTPNNTLPIIWYDEDDEEWTPIFKRYNKVYF